jgi:hypothetical protein
MLVVDAASVDDGGIISCVLGVLLRTQRPASGLVAPRTLVP